MKKLFLILTLLVLVGTGCLGQPPVSSNVVSHPDWKTYTNSDYGFSFQYPSNLEAHVRTADQQDATYVGLPAKFFLSLRDTVREEKPVSLAFFYAFDDLTFDQFVDVLKASDAGNITIVETTDVEQGGTAMKKVVSTTAVGINKVHYVWTHGSTLIVVSQFLNEDETFGEVFQTLKAE